MWFLLFILIPYNAAWLENYVIRANIFLEFCFMNNPIKLIDLNRSIEKNFATGEGDNVQRLRQEKEGEDFYVIQEFINDYFLR